MPLLTRFRVGPQVMGSIGEVTVRSSASAGCRARPRLMGRLGLEPRTTGLKGRCSTIELAPRTGTGSLLDGRKISYTVSDPSETLPIDCRAREAAGK